MPVDYIKAWLKNVNPDTLINNPKFKKTFENYKDENLGEHSRWVLKYRNLNIIIFKNDYVLLTGSLHYYHNKGLHNYDDFKFHNIIDTIYDISNLLRVDLENFILLNIEFGVNITPYFKPNKIITNLLLHRKKEFLKPYNLNYKASKHQRFWIKVYNKGEQFKKPYNILRIELKYKKMIDLNKIGLYTLKDLTNLNIYDTLLELLKNKWKECILYDYSIETSTIKPLQQKKILEYQNINYWLNLSDLQRQRQKNNLRNLSTNFGNNIQQVIKEMIVSKWNELLKKSMENNQYNKGLLYIQNKKKNCIRL